MRLLQLHDWPGNIRELQNLLERAVLVTSGSVLTMPKTDLTRRFPEQSQQRVRTLAELERSSIKEALRRTNWVVGGNNGAAAQLGIPRTTLLARMSKHGISRQTLALPDGELATHNSNRLERAEHFSAASAFSATA